MPGKGRVLRRELVAQIDKTWRVPTPSPRRSGPGIPRARRPSPNVRRTTPTQSSNANRVGESFREFRGRGRGVLRSTISITDLRCERDNTRKHWRVLAHSAELRLVPFLPTHLPYPRIVARLHVSRNTVKSQSDLPPNGRRVLTERGVERLREIGLLET